MSFKNQKTDGCAISGTAACFRFRRPHSFAQPEGTFSAHKNSITFQELVLLELVVVEQFPQEEPVPDSLARHWDQRWRKESSWLSRWLHKHCSADSRQIDTVARDNSSDRELPRLNFPSTDLFQQQAEKMSGTCVSSP
jgi:hypothetical protein